jgi:hypothetical protein
MLNIINGRGLMTIYVLFEVGTTQLFQDTYSGEPEPTPIVPAPPGLYTPQRGFGKVWRENNLQASLGWATAPETVATYNPETEPAPPSPVPTSLPGVATPTPAPPPPTVVPPSTRGFPAVLSFGSKNFGANLIIYAGPALAKFYVTYDFGRRWAAFDDTFR